MKDPIYIASEIYRQSRYARKHPLSIPRISTTTDLIRSLGWLAQGQYLEGPIADRRSLLRYHDADYVDALMRAEDGTLTPAEMDRWNIGRNGNPIYPEVYRRPATAAGSSILAAKLVLDGGTVHSPAGGTHHGQKDRASGFCFLNDPVLAILTLLDQGIEPIVYVDLDAHHGDGVEAAFIDDPRVLTLSIHERGRWPRTGDRPTGAGSGAMNLPVPEGLNDDEFLFILETAILPSVAAMDPEALVIQCGVDGLADDPMSKLCLSNRVFPTAVSALMSLAPRRIVLGGGGYNPYAVARAWALVWAALAGHDVPDRLPLAAERLLREINWRHSMARTPPERWFTTLLDPAKTGPIRAETRDMVRQCLLAA